MDYKRFSPVNKNNVIAYLTYARVSGYHPSDLNGLNEAELSTIEQTTITVGNKILSVNIQDESELAKAQTMFYAAVKSLKQFDHKFPFVQFSSQLLQYNTIISDDEFKTEFTAKEFYEFLQCDSNKFGDCSNNLFVVEYKLIKIYNNLAHLNDASKGLVAKVPNSKEQIEFIFEQLNELNKLVIQWELEAPNVFVKYLAFASNYTIAKALELGYNENNTTISKEEGEYFADSQQYALKQALEKIKEIKNLIEFATSQKMAVPGIQFSLGRNVFNQLPIENDEDVNTIAEHVSSLIRM